jgi:hypothetical protein
VLNTLLRRAHLGLLTRDWFRQHSRHSPCSISAGVGIGLRRYSLVDRRGPPPADASEGRARTPAALISVLTTDFTVTEVAKKHTQSDYEVIAEVGRM